MKTRLLSLTLFFLLGFSAQVFAVEYDDNTLFFEHWRHYDSQGIPCETCHKGPNKGIFTLPGHPECEACHPPGKKNDYEKASSENCDKCHPKDTTYSSRILSTVDRSNRSFFHTDKTHSLCTVCHGPMLEDSVFMGQMLLSQDERNKVRRKSHRFHFAEDCKACHLDKKSKTKKPVNHDKDWLNKGHITVAPEFRCRICHTKSFCKNCHEDTY